jgi:hypothetical protein
VAIVFDQVSIPDIARVGRRTMVSAVIVAVVALGVGLVLNYPLAGVGACVGMGLGMLNFRMITASVLRVGRRADANKRRPLALNTLSRLAAISLVTLGLLFLSFQLGFGVLGGLALFQVLLLANTTRAMFAAGQMAAGGEGDGEGPAAGGQAIDATAQVPGED